MEFLMTYGWAILVVLAAVAALAYFGVLSPGKILPERCLAPAGLDCIDRATVSATTDVIDLALKNNLGYDINVTGYSDTETSDGCTTNGTFVCEGVGCGLAIVDPNGKIIRNGQQITTRFSCSNDFNTGRFSYDVAMTYTNRETGLPHSASISIRSNAE